MKLFQICNAEQLLIFQIVHSIFIWGLNWLDIPLWLHRFSILNQQNCPIIKSFGRFCNRTECTVRVHVNISIRQCTAASGNVFHSDRNHALGILRIILQNLWRITLHGCKIASSYCVASISIPVKTTICPHYNNKL